MAARSGESEVIRTSISIKRRGEGETSVWGTQQDAEFKFCKFAPCTWQSFGTRAGDGVPHAFEARSLLLKLAQDPAVVRIMREREWTVGLLAELDPIDDRLAEKMEGGGKRLLGYNTNHGAQIHVRLRTDDLSTFLPYDQVVDTILHELAQFVRVIWPQRAIVRELQALSVDPVDRILQLRK